MNISSGLADFIIVNDYVDYECIKTILPKFNNIYLGSHPSYNHCINFSGNSLLVLVPGAYYEEFPIIIMNKWYSIIYKILNIYKLNDIHFRFHPREGSEVRLQFKNFMTKNGIPFVENDSRENSIKFNFSDYKIIIGSKSSSLRFARQCSPNSIVVGIKNACFSGYWSQPFGIGDMNGITWINNAEELEIEKLEQNTLIHLNHPKLFELIEAKIQNLGSSL